MQAELDGSSYAGPFRAAGGYTACIAALDAHRVGVQWIVIAGVLVVVIRRAMIEFVTQSELTTNE
jgi:hypothetical protein